jgi:hypothetical protein
MTMKIVGHDQMPTTASLLFRLVTLVSMLLFSGSSHAFIIQKSPIRSSAVAIYSSRKNVVVAVIGNHVSGIVAAIAAAEAAADDDKENDDIKVLLLTGHQDNLHEEEALEEWPDPLLTNRQLMERLASGGKELAGLLATKGSPEIGRKWLEDHDIHFSDADHGGESESDAENTKTMLETLANDKTLKRVRKDGDDISAMEILWRQLEPAGVQVVSGVNITSLTVTTKHNRAGFQIDYINQNEDTQQYEVDRLILAGDCVPQSSIPVGVEESSDEVDKTDSINTLLDRFDDEPLSRKEQMALEKKLSKQKKTKKRIKDLPVQREALPMSNDNKLSESPSVLSVNTLARMLGHATTPECSGLFSFGVQRNVNHNSKFPSGVLTIPKARLRCQLKDPPKGRRRLPRVEGPFMLSQEDGLLTGPASLKLASVIAQDLCEANYQAASIHIHFAPDLGSTDEIQEKLVEHSDPETSVLGSACPLVHIEVDYEDYDFDTGDFRRIVLPLVPDDLWRELCEMAKITSTDLCWKDMTKNVSLERLVRTMVDYSLPILSLEPISTISAGGVSLKELVFPDCASRHVEGFYVCGVAALNAHGTTRATNDMVSVSTGYLAGIGSIESLGRRFVEKQ